MKREDKFLLSAGLAFISLILFKTVSFLIDTNNKFDYYTLKLWLDISLYITIVICAWLIISSIGFFIAHKIDHDVFLKNENPDSQPIPSKLFSIAAILCFILPPIGLSMFIYLVVYYKMR